MQRYPDWAARLDEFLAEHTSKPFRYGSWDCCLFVAGAVNAMTGIDLAREFRGQYQSAKDAAALYRMYGSTNLAGLVERVAARFGMPLVDAGHASRGDMVLVKRPREHSLGLVALDGARILVVGAHGVYRIPLGLGLKAWKV